ncbi:hypothetical protein HPB47_012846 [Ixodes persulcatus]|uniref:Uncharacterized protein n=1 Tax=Ixodes persulcatus TaxID=34615 RepID=A0AC60NSE7_IXOPE|nr:hypothetical protein HPB47_012846 [Ixodes persulcatus]
MPFGLHQISLQHQEFRTDSQNVNTRIQEPSCHSAKFAPRGLTQASLPRDPSRMQSSPQAMDTEWRPASGQATRYTNYVTIIVKFTDGLNLAALPHHEIGDRIIIAGPRLPRYALYNRVVMRLYPYRPRSLQCHHCYAIGHQADVCPKKRISITCPACSTPLPIEMGIATPHTCEPFCLNCQGEHPPGTPTFPARAQADVQTQAGQQYYRERFLTTHRSRKDPPVFHGRVHWPALPTSNRFAALNNSSRSRSPGHQPETAQTATKKPATQAVVSAPSRGLNHNPRRRHKTTIDADQTKNISKENSLRGPEQRPRESSSVSQFARQPDARYCPLGGADDMRG